MTRFMRMRIILLGICMIAVSLMMLAFPDVGYVLATIILGTVLVFDGLKQLLYFFSMGIHMVGGRIILYRALITLDVGVFTLTIHGSGLRYIMFYFVMYYIFAGMVSMFRALEARKYGAGSWKFNFAAGIYDVVISMICLLNNRSAKMMLDILCLALIVSGVNRIVMASRWGEPVGTEKSGSNQFRRKT